MSVGKPNVRFVFHYGASNSLDAYHQELGRAGRARFKGTAHEAVKDQKRIASICSITSARRLRPAAFATIVS
jgi:superfamily II DNA helicase RecQ